MGTKVENLLRALGQMGPDEKLFEYRSRNFMEEVGKDLTKFNLLFDIVEMSDGLDEVSRRLSERINVVRVLLEVNNNLAGLEGLSNAEKSVFKLANKWKGIPEKIYDLDDRVRDGMSLTLDSRIEVTFK